MSFDWATPGAAADLQEMWCGRGIAATDIARLLTAKYGEPLTRNAVLGRVHRLGLAKGATQLAAPAIAIHRDASTCKALPGATLMELQSWHCRYILPEAGTGTRYCGEVTENPKSSWCPHHSSLVWVQRPPGGAGTARSAAARRANPDHRPGPIVSTFSRSPALADEPA